MDCANRYFAHNIYTNPPVYSYVYTLYILATTARREYSGTSKADARREYSHARLMRVRANSHTR